MNFDWAVSLFVVTLIVFGLIVVEEVEFAGFERTYASQTVTGSVAQMITDQVDRLEGVAATTSALFEYNQSHAGAVELPATLLNQPSYQVDFTHDYVIVLTSGGTPVGEAIDFWQPVYVFSLNTTQALLTTPINGTHLANWAASSSCDYLSLVSGTAFLVTHEPVLVDGHSEYLTIISSAYAPIPGC